MQIMSGRPLSNDIFQGPEIYVTMCCHDGIMRGCTKLSACTQGWIWYQQHLNPITLSFYMGLLPSALLVAILGVESITLFPVLFFKFSHPRCEKCPAFSIFFNSNRIWNDWCIYNVKWRFLQNVDWQTFSVKCQIGNNFCFVGYIFSVTRTQL